ncbi:polysaccharide deacetylase family protein [Rubripirellula sp.]|nr:polysaccharide deacetylase family protein [Rubripirellula sp.]
MNEFDSEKTSLVSGQPLFLILCVLVLLLPCLHQDVKGQQKDRLENEPKVNENRVVILTFDDASASHYSIVRPLLLKYQFGATFFITEGWDFSSNKKDYLTWEQIRTMDRDGFEIGNHTRDHMGITEKTVSRLNDQLIGIEQRCEQYEIQKPVSFAWPGNAITPSAFPILKEHGILFARRGGAPEYPYEFGQGFPYEPGVDHPYLIPSAGDARPNWQLEDFIRAVEKSEEGRLAVIQFHGVPDTAHSWVSSPVDQFEAYLRYLALKKFKVIALRDADRYVNPHQWPEDPFAIIEKRKKELANQ